MASVPSRPTFSTHCPASIYRTSAGCGPVECLGPRSWPRGAHDALSEPVARTPHHPVPRRHESRRLQAPVVEQGLTPVNNADARTAVGHVVRQGLAHHMEGLLEQRLPGIAAALICLRRFSRQA